MNARPFCEWRALPTVICLIPVATCFGLCTNLVCIASSLFCCIVLRSLTAVFHAYICVYLSASTRHVLDSLLLAPIVCIELLEKFSTFLRLYAANVNALRVLSLDVRVEYSNNHPHYKCLRTELRHSLVLDMFEREMFIEGRLETH